MLLSGRLMDERVGVGVGSDESGVVGPAGECEQISKHFV
jgi:hypothetical protein